MVNENAARVETANGAGSDEISVMVVDDSLVIRGMIARMIDATPGMHVAASVPDGQRAVTQIEKTPVDIVVLDIEMPVMDGLTALPILLEKCPKTKVIMASTLTGPNAEASLKALSLGAADYLPKPTTSKDISGVGGSDVFKRDLISKIEALGLSAKRRRGHRVGTSHSSAVQSAPSQPGTGKNERALLYSGPVTLRPEQAQLRRPKILAVGSSTGGPQALMHLFKNLKHDIGVPIVVTQHMPPKFTTMLAEHIAAKSGYPCVEAQDGMALEPNKILLAPGDYHMEVRGTVGNATVALNQNPPENFCRPAVDPMMRSLVDVYGDRILALILTGMGSDGLKGGRVVVEAGGTMIAQDEQTSVVWGMPGAVATAGICTAVLPLDEIAGYVGTRISKGLP